jgi:SAM-dependent methyltransferase
MDRKQHWENVYATKRVTEVSWFEAEPRVSLELIERASPAHGSVIDVGGGASLLVDRLLDRGFKKIAVLDISAAALEHARARLGARAEKVQWITGDVTSLEDVGTFDVWHDRAVFHFLTDAEDRRKYVALARRSVKPGGHLIVGTFAVDGPPMCSGLDVCRYDAEHLARELGPDFQLVHQLAHSHTTPWGKPQAFVFGLFRRV